MSLVGNLEDLGLGDILQIVSLSRKSGELVLQSLNREGKIIFQNGQVIRATSTSFRENLGDILVRREITDAETIRKALLLQRETNPPERLGKILTERFNIKKETIDGIVREQIEKIVYSFFGWSEGTFAFDLGETEEVVTARFDPLLFMLDQGLNPQWLAMEGSRLLDEKIHRGEVVEEETSESLFDLDDMFGQETTGPDSVGERSAETVAEVSTGRTPAETAADNDVPTSRGFNLGAELRLELGEDQEGQKSLKGPESPGLHLLRGMLQELQNPALGGGIILLVLRFASEMMNRSVIFLVKDDEIVGLGQFGIEPVDGEVADIRVRKMKIPRNEGSIFESLLNDWTPVKVKPRDQHWDNYLIEQLGGGVPEQIFLGPIISEGRVVAILYGDNIPEQKPIGDTESMEIFLSQAGLAMEKALLERRLRNRDTAV